MGYDPSAGTFRPLADQEAVKKFIEKVPSGVIFTEGETINLKGCDFYVHEVGESRLILKPKREPKP